MHVQTRDAKVVERFSDGPLSRAFYDYYAWKQNRYGLFSEKKIRRVRQITKALIDHERRIEK